MTSETSLLVAGGRRLRITLGALLTSTAIGLLFSQPAHAQQVIEGGTSETVIGGGGGTQPDPWNVGDDLTIGDNGTGTLTITNGGGVVSDVGRIGYDSTGTVTVDGPGSGWNLQGNSLYVGIVGAGNLNITDSAVVLNGSGIIADESGSEGVVNVNGGGALWNNSSSLIVGSSGEATLNITNTGSVINSTARIGDREGSLGYVNVDGLGSTWDSTSSLHVGDQGDGLLSISNRGVVNSNSGVIGASTTGFGHVRVDLATWTITNALDVGNDGVGRLTISNSGTVVNNDAIVGSAATSHGTVTVEDLGTVWSSATLFVGESGTGEVNINNQGTVNSNVGVIGSESDGVGIVTVDGGTWNNATNMRVGNLGRGTLAISAAGSVNSAAGFVAASPGGVGEVTVHGIGSNWTTTGGMYIGWQGDATLTLTNGGRVTVGSGELTLADSAPTTGTLNIGAGDAAGLVDALTVDGGSGAAAINFNHNEADYYFTNDGLVAGTSVTITGSTAVNHIGSGTTVLRGNNTYTGGTTISNGTLRNMGLVGDVVVNGGTFGGDGTAAIVTVNSGGTLAPGNSIGVMTAASATFNAGSTYEIELDDGGNLAGVNNDVLNVTGVADINGGTVHVMPENGTDDGSTYTPGTTYTIMTAAGGVNGEFDSVSDAYAFLYFTLDYDANTVFLNSELATSFCIDGMSDNQCATGDGTFSLGVGNSVFDAVAVLTNTEAPIALDQLSGEIHASAKTALLEDSRFPREVAMDRLRVALAGVGADDNAQIEDQVSESTGLWGQGFGSWSRWSSDGNAAATGRNIGGLFVGGDALVRDQARFGVMGGYSRSSFSVDDRASSGTTDTYTLGVYGGGEWDAFTMTGGAAHSWHSLDTSRSVAFSGFSDSLSASYSARTMQAWGEAAYSFETGAARFEPFANLAYVNLSTDGFTESGGAAALTAAPNTVDATFAMLGLRAETDMMLGNMHATLRSTVGWRHAFGGAPTSQMAFASGGNAFSVAGVPLGQDTLVLEAGFDLNLSENSTLDFTYGGQFGSGVQDRSARASLNVRF
jgi:outer membrane autotransporter protein